MRIGISLSFTVLGSNPANTYTCEDSRKVVPGEDPILQMLKHMNNFIRVSSPLDVTGWATS